MSQRITRVDILMYLATRARETLALAHGGTITVGRTWLCVLGLHQLWAIEQPGPAVVSLRTSPAVRRTAQILRLRA